jgi:hypothetical protein
MTAKRPDEHCDSQWSVGPSSGACSVDAALRSGLRFYRLGAAVS